MNKVYGAVLAMCVALSGCSRNQTDPASQKAAAGGLSITQTTGLQKSGGGPLRLSVRLRDGSLIVATPVRSEIVLTTSYGVINVPFSNVRSILISDSAGSAIVGFRNGDRIQGTLQSGEIPLETSLGRIDVNVSAIAEVSGALTAAEITEGLVASYPLDGTTEDASGHGRNGVNHGAVPCADRFGRPAGAYEFNGNGAYIALPEGLINPEGPEFTWTVWASARDVDAYRFLLYIGANTAESILFVKGGTFIFGVALKDGQRIGASAGARSGQYVHLACVYRRGKSLQLWLDGTLAEESHVADGPLLSGSNQHSSTIGSYAPEQPNHMRSYGIMTWHGSVDDLRIYNRALDESEIKSLAHDRP